MISTLTTNHSAESCNGPLVEGKKMMECLQAFRYQGALAEKLDDTFPSSAAELHPAQRKGWPGSWLAGTQSGFLLYSPPT